MNEDISDPVEISTRMRPGEWTPETLTELVGSYQQKLKEMGAPDSEIDTTVDTPEDGSAQVNVTWIRTGIHTYAAAGPSMTEESENSRGHGERIPLGEATQDSQGLGAVLGDAERSPIDGPPTERAVQAEENQPEPDFIVYTGQDGKSYVEDAGPPKE
jgi:hypothetical protein